MASRTSTHRLRMRVTRVAAVRCWTSGRPRAWAKAYAANVAAAMMPPAGMGEQADRGRRPPVGERVAAQRAGGVRQPQDPPAAGGQAGGLRQLVLLAAGQHHLWRP